MEPLTPQLSPIIYSMDHDHAIKALALHHEHIYAHGQQLEELLATVNKDLAEIDKLRITFNDLLLRMGKRLESLESKDHLSRYRLDNPATVDGDVRQLNAQIKDLQRQLNEQKDAANTGFVMMFCFCIICMCLAIWIQR